MAKATVEGEGKSPEEMDTAIRQLVSRAVASEEVIDILAAAGLKKPDISILSDDFLQEVRQLPHRNLAVELLRKLLNDEIKTNSRKNVVQARSFAEMLEKAIRKYQNRAIEAAQVSEGKTPEASIYAQVLTEIKRFNRRAEQSRFVQHGKRYVGLSKWMGRGLAFEIEQHNKKVRQALHKSLLETEWDAFEELIARLLAEMGFEEIEVTSRSKDGGIDVRGTLVVGDVIRTRMAIQVKKWKRNVQAPVVQQVRGSLGSHEQGIIRLTQMK